MLLAIDSATQLISVALHDGVDLLGEHSWIAGRRHNEKLAPTVRDLLAGCGAAMRDLTGLAVTNGPGSYTGLRIGVAFAKGVASVQKLPLVSMTTLDLIALSQPHFQNGTGLIALVQAGRGKIIAAAYHWSQRRWRTRTEPRLMTWDDLLATVDGPATLTGEINKTGHEVVANRPDDAPTLQIAPPVYRMRRAGFLAQHAWDQINAAGDDLSAFAAGAVMPIYLQTDKPDSRGVTVETPPAEKAANDSAESDA